MNLHAFIFTAIAQITLCLQRLDVALYFPPPAEDDTNKLNLNSKRRYMLTYTNHRDLLVILQNCVQSCPGVATSKPTNSLLQALSRTYVHCS